VWHCFCDAAFSCVGRTLACDVWTDILILITYIFLCRVAHTHATRAVGPTSFFRRPADDDAPTCAGRRLLVLGLTCLRSIILDDVQLTVTSI